MKGCLSILLRSPPKIFNGIQPPKENSKWTSSEDITNGCYLKYRFFLKIFRKKKKSYNFF